MSTRKRDPWVDVKTHHGLPADQVISALQKEIRRGNAENAVLLAYEMVLTSPAMEDYLWKCSTNKKKRRKHNDVSRTIRDGRAPNVRR